MANYRRLISYIYAYEGEVKGRNIGFVKLESRNGQCKLSVNVKKVYVGSSDLGVYLLCQQKEIFLGSIFIRSGCGEFRGMVKVDNVADSGHSMDDCYGLTIHEKGDSWRAYTTIWEDAVAHAAELELADVTSSQIEGTEAQLQRKVEELNQELSETEGSAPCPEPPEIPGQPEILDHPEIPGQPEIPDHPELPSQPGLPDHWELPEQSAFPEPPEERSDPPLESEAELPEESEAGLPMESDGPGQSEISGQLEILEQEEMPERPEIPELPEIPECPEIPELPEQEKGLSAIRSEEPYPEEPYPEEPYPQEPHLQEPHPEEPSEAQPEALLFPGDPQELERLDQEEKQKASPLRLWDRFRKQHPKIQAFDSSNGCEILTIKPQDIGLLPRENWVYGNNSFLLHGYYNYRYLILARIGGEECGRVRYILGVPGNYYSNEKYMASMFGFPHFVLSKKQPLQDGRFGYWYTDVKMENQD